MALAKGFQIDLCGVQEKQDDQRQFGNDVQKMFCLGQREHARLGHQDAEADEEDDGEHDEVPDAAAAIEPGLAVPAALLCLLQLGRADHAKTDAPSPTGR